jgi:hypothetical protein
MRFQTPLTFDSLMNLEKATSFTAIASQRDVLSWEKIAYEKYS